MARCSMSLRAGPLRGPSLYRASAAQTPELLGPRPWPFPGSEVVLSLSAWGYTSELSGRGREECP